MPETLELPEHIKAALEDISRELCMRGYGKEEEPIGLGIAHYATNILSRNMADPQEGPAPVIEIISPGLAYQKHHINFAAVRQGEDPPQYLALGAGENPWELRGQAVDAMSLSHLHAELCVRDTPLQKIFDAVKPASPGSPLGSFALGPRLAKVTPAA